MKHLHQIHRRASGARTVRTRARYVNLRARTARDRRGRPQTIGLATQPARPAIGDPPGSRSCGRDVGSSAARGGVAHDAGAETNSYALCCKSNAAVFLSHGWRLFFSPLVNFNPRPTDAPFDATCASAGTTPRAQLDTTEPATVCVARPWIRPSYRSTRASRTLTAQTFAHVFSSGCALERDVLHRVLLCHPDKAGVRFASTPFRTPHLARSQPYGRLWHPSAPVLAQVRAQSMRDDGLTLRMARS